MRMQSLFNIGFMLFCSQVLFASGIASIDTIRPIITIQASSVDFPCSGDIATDFTMWYDTAGGAIGSDNSGPVSWISTIPYIDALNLVENGTEGNCGTTASLLLGFIAMDTCGNTSLDTTFAFYTTIDIVKPTLITPAQDLDVACDFGVDDLLDDWIQNHASSMAIDECGDVIWEEYIWSDSNGNNGFGTTAEDDGIEINPEDCTWHVNVSFFAKDECGNLAITTGTFSVIDSLPPSIFPLPEDLTVDCSEVPPLESYQIIDACDGEVGAIINEETTQNPSVDSCSHSNYLIYREWIFEDNCGNRDTMEQNIVVIDTLPPTVNVQPVLSLSCTSDITDYTLFFNLNDDCGPVEIDYVDGETTSTQCVQTFERTWSIRDVCGNELIFLQDISLQDTEEPFISATAQDLMIPCDSEASLNTLVTQWIENLGGAVANDGCSELSSFVASPDSYDINQPSTFPGDPISTLFNIVCEDRAGGIFYEESVDFVFFDACGNAVKSQANIILLDTIPPTFVDCESSLNISLENNLCEVEVDIEIPSVEDNCTFNTGIFQDSIQQEIFSTAPGNQSVIINPVNFVFGPYNSNTIFPLGTGEIQINFSQLDMNGPQERFVIEVEGNILDTTDIISQECGDTTFLIQNISDENWNLWLSDEFLEINLSPLQPDPGILGINDVCQGSNVSLLLSFPLQTNIQTQIEYSLNNGQVTPIPNDTLLKLTLSEGIHLIDFIATDCGGNKTICTREVEITDGFPPMIDCPADTVIVLDIGTCIVDYTLNPDYSYVDNCLGENIVTLQSPQDISNGFLLFEFDEVEAVYQANDVVFEFDVPEILGLNYNPSVRLNFQIDLSEGSNVELFSENGQALQIIDESLGCFPQKGTNYDINIDDFTTWSEDGLMSFTLAVNGIVNPCDQVDLNGLDGLSFAQLELSYSEVLPSINITGDTVISTFFTDITMSPNFEFQQGSYAIEYVVEDNSGNEASCTYNLTITDEEDPTIECINATTVFLHPSGLIDFELTEEAFVTSSSDNCGIESMVFEPSFFTCDDADTQPFIQAIISDPSGNKDTCTTKVNVKNYELLPTFSSGLCIGDTLQLFSNVPEAPIADAYTFSWSGPNSFVSNIENPFIVSPDASYSGTYTFTVEGFNGCISTSNIEVQVEQLSEPNLISNDFVFCEGESTLLNSTFYTGDISYEWYEGLPPNGILFEESNGPSIEISPVQGSHMYYVLAVGTECSSSPSPVIEITVVEKPTPSITDPFISVCEGEPILFSSDIFDENFVYNWIGPNGYLGSGQFPEGIESAIEENQGTYTLSIENQGCISDTANFQVTVFDKPPKPIINGESLICEGSNFFLSVTNITTADKYEWYKDGVFYSTILNNNSLNVPLAFSTLSGSWQVIAIEGACESDFSESITVVVEPKIPIGANNNGPVCEGDSVQLNVSFIPDASYVWESPANDIFLGQKPIIFGTAGEYSVTLTTANGCTNTSATTVEIIDVPSINSVSNSAPICLDGQTDIQFLSSVFPEGDYEYIWSGPGFVSNEPDPVLENATTLNNGNYTLQVINQGCNAESSTTVVEMIETPISPIIIEVLNTCQGENMVVKSNYPNNSNLTFEWVIPTGIVTNQSSELIINNVLEIHEGNYRVRVIEEGCESVFSDDFFIEVFNFPSPPIIVGTNQLCEGETITLSTNSINNATTWFGPNGFEATGTTLEIFNCTSIHEGNYTAVFEENGCISNVSIPFNVDIIPIPNAPIIPINKDTICRTQLGNYTFCLEPSSVDTFDQLMMVDIENSDALFDQSDYCFSINLADSDLESYNFGIFGFIDGCESPQSEIITLTVFDDISLIASINNEDIYACDSIVSNIEAIVPSADINILWTSTDTMVSITNPNSAITDIKLLEKGIYQLILESSHVRCGLIGYDTIQIIFEDEIQAFDDLTTLDLDEEISISIFDNDESVNDFSFEVIFEPSNLEYEFDGDQLAVLSGNVFVGTDSLLYEICSNECPNICDEAVVIFQIGDATNCFVSNVITPNNDGFNDYIVVPCLNAGLYPENKLTIFNQWGDEVFYAQPYENNWDGRYNGEYLPSGTYFYILELNSSRQELHGFIILQE